MCCSAGTSYTVEKLVSIFSSEDHEFNNHPNKSDRDACLKTLALAELEKANYFIQLLEPHKRVWADIWDKSDIVVDGDRYVNAEADASINIARVWMAISASPMAVGTKWCPAGQNCCHVALSDAQRTGQPYLF